MQAHACILDLRGSCLSSIGWQIASTSNFEVEVLREADLSAHQTFCEAERRRELADATYYAQMAYNEAFHTLKPTKNRFFQALICNQMAVNAGKAGEALRHIASGLAILAEELGSLQNRFLEERTPQVLARPQLAPWLELKTILAANQQELQNLEQSLDLQDKKRAVEKCLHHGRYDQALLLCSQALQEAQERFCASHWWCGVFRLGQSYAQSKQAAIAEAFCALRKAELLLADWGNADEPASDFLRRERRWIERLRQELGSASC